VKACEKEKKGSNPLNNFPQVEIHYKKAEKMNEEEKEERNKERKRKLSIDLDKFEEVVDEKLRLNAIKRQLKEMTINKDNKKNYFRARNV
jgi:hypothetical protein